MAERRAERPGYTFLQITQNCVCRSDWFPRCDYARNWHDESPDPLRPESIIVIPKVLPPSNPADATQVMNWEPVANPKGCLDERRYER